MVICLQQHLPLHQHHLQIAYPGWSSASGFFVFICIQLFISTIRQCARYLHHRTELTQHYTFLFANTGLSFGGRSSNSLCRQAGATYDSFCEACQIDTSSCDAVRPTTADALTPLLAVRHTDSPAVLMNRKPPSTVAVISRWKYPSCLVMLRKNA